jgi:hypothetical protein
MSVQWVNVGYCIRASVVIVYFNFMMTTSQGKYGLFAMIICANPLTWVGATVMAAKIITFG